MQATDYGSEVFIERIIIGSFFYNKILALFQSARILFALTFKRFIACPDFFEE